MAKLMHKDPAQSIPPDHPGVATGRDPRFRGRTVLAFCKSCPSPVIMPRSAFCGSSLSSSLSLKGVGPSPHRLRLITQTSHHGTQPCVEGACNLEPNSMVCRLCHNGILSHRMESTACESVSSVGYCRERVLDAGTPARNDISSEIII